jgi:S-adenosylmethionine-dependent methyltransferase
MTLSGFDTQQWRQSPLEGLRHTLAEANLARHWGTEPSRVLDVAGGNGMAAVRLAAQGHEVTVLDPAGAMLSTAIDLAEWHGVADRLHVVQATAQDAPEVFLGHEFDLVLCHNLLHYAESADERESVLRAIMAPLRPGGLLSVLGPNEGPGAVGEVVAALAMLGVDEVVRYGVRCLPDEDDDLPALERLELSLSDRMPDLLTARYYHLIARC